ncbi:hypothetical protein HOY80DRAFT_1136168 [Tuber brumale]|nr:hypothetical protein HOY80DRAFT_1136168 [Tuber brumale]
MRTVEKSAAAASTARRELEIKTLLREAVSEGVNDLTKLLNENERSGRYKNQEALRESKLFVALMEERERLGNLTDSILELQEKLSKEVEDPEKAEDGNSGGTFKMSQAKKSQAKMSQDIESLRMELAEKCLIRYDILEDVDDLTRSFHACKSVRSYKNREESHKSEEWLALVEKRDRLDEITNEILEMQQKLKKKVEEAGRN